MALQKKPGEAKTPSPGAGKGIAERPAERSLVRPAKGASDGSERFRKYLPGVEREKSPQEKFEEVIAHFKQGRMETTNHAYAWDLKNFRKYLGVPEDWQVVAMLVTDQARANRMVRDYIQHLRTEIRNEQGEVTKKASSPATVSRYVSCLKMLARSARALDYGVADIVEKTPKVKRYKDTAGPCEEAVLKIYAHYERLIKSENEDVRIVALRDYAIIRLMSGAGLRRKEVLSLNTEHVDWQNETVKLLGKGELEREDVKVPKAAMRILRLWFDERAKRFPKEKALFVSFSTADYGAPLVNVSVNGFVKELQDTLFGPEPEKGYKLAPHRFRHYAITATAKKNDNPYDVTSFARHSKMDTTLVYIDNLKQRGRSLAQEVEDEMEAKLAEELKRT